MRRLSLDTARRIAIGAQGLGGPRPEGRVDVRHFRRVMDHIGLLQLDSVNVIARSHYLPVLARVGPYSPDALDRFTVGSGEVFEYWGHMASLIPSDQHRLFRWRMESFRPWGSVQKLAAEDPGYVEKVYEEIRDRGPASVSSLEDAGERTGPWWGYARGKLALEWLFAQGRITAYRGRNFERIYDMPDRVLQRDHYEAPPVSRDEAYRELLVRAARHHGVGSARDLADYHRLHIPTARPILADLVSRGDLHEVEVEGWSRPAFLHPQARRPRRIVGSALLSPFDSLIWERRRTERLFGFRYRVEIYTPKEKRIYGYYVLPYLLDGALVARVDLKAHRKDGILEVRAAHLESGNDPGRVAGSLASDVETMAAWMGLSAVRVAPVGDLAEALVVAL